MAPKVVIHSNTKRLVQVVGIAILVAAALTGLKRAAEWWKSSRQLPSIASIDSAQSGGESQGSLIVGQSTVIDADTLEIGGVRVRLDGVDALESSQGCSESGAEWDCGRQAEVALREWLSTNVISCNPKGKDRYQRTLARCFFGDEDVQAWLVLNGWALAYREYSTDYVSAEEVARTRKSGMWRGEHVAPWEWRRSKSEQ